MLDFVKEQKIVVFDLETSEAFKRGDRGLIFTPERARIVQIGGVVLEGGKITGDVFEHLVCPEPGYYIEEESTAVHGIDSGMIRGAMDEKEAIEFLLSKIGDDKLMSALAGQNIVGFDLGIINWQINNRISKTKGINYSMPTSTYDTLVFARKLNGRAKGGNSNSALAERYGIDLELAKVELSKMTGKDYTSAKLHTALYDSMITAKILEKMIEQSPEMFI